MFSNKFLLSILFALFLWGCKETKEERCGNKPFISDSRNGTWELNKFGYTVFVNNNYYLLCQEAVCQKGEVMSEGNSRFLLGFYSGEIGERLSNITLRQKKNFQIDHLYELQKTFPSLTADNEKVGLHLSRSYFDGECECGISCTHIGNSYYLIQTSDKNLLPLNWELKD